MGILRSSIQLGTAVTDEAVTVVSCTHHTHHLQAHKYAQIRLKRAQTGEHADVDLEQVEKALRSMASALKIKNCDCVMSVPLSNTTFGFFEAPKGVTQKQAHTLLKEHICSLFSVPAREVRFKEWAVQGSQTKENAREVFGYYALERSVLDSWKVVYARAGLRLVRIAVDMPSITYLLAEQEKHESSSSGAPLKGTIEVGERSTLCTIGGKEGLFSMETLPWGMRDAYKKNDLSGLGDALAPAAAMVHERVVWHIFAPNELLATIQQFFIHHLKFEISPLKMFMEIPPRFRVSAYVKASAAAGYPSKQCIIV
ncbi:MAG: hypothetical protein UX10_C0009G0017 [Candidatus Magasanikbacteria bacterium GW2011_GWA2_45_39]|uniref:Type IV pilus assembly protein PilM n=2 Tax=Candidatus Magasanikiibacteriota TaxID=1752731 RepID=A0A0G1N1I5_9BACT|nr:MAG: hypothetical protein UX10_C0009G0017 [Candidatus Magasanikbacteria bacterium GW2011_GWA2_45_39]KKU14192.1 MAG: hypothetical protein UX20_C0004G0019 [Candidatus Magasanikbacteria bacterium GW2011_GWC2_45_8]HBW73788.1 hypothetical protein [Candidatus Magasanikbacteria bacterium]